MRLRILLWATLVTVFVWPAAADADGKSGAGTTGVRVVLELNQQFYYAGDPFPLRVSVLNDDAEMKANPVKTPIVEGIEVRRRDGAVVKPTGKAEASEPAPRPDKIGGGGFYGTIVDLTQVYPEMRSPGSFEIRWTAEGIPSNTIDVNIIAKYDPTKDYQARFDTDEGHFIVDFFKASAPVATKAFVDMANAGFYDGLLLHEVRPDWYVSGGDPNGDGTGGAPFRFPAELGSVPVVAGTVLMKPAGAAPPANSSQFIIMLRPEPSWLGQFTVLGQVVEGLDVLQKISRLPSSQQAARPFYKPLKDVPVRKITIVEKRPMTGPAASGGTP